MNTLKLLDLKDSVYFTDDVYIDKKCLIFIGGSSLSSEMKRLLHNWQFTNLYTEGECLESKPVNADKKETVKAAPAEKKETLKVEKQSGALVAKTYAQFTAFTRSIFETYQQSKVLDVENIIARMKEFSQFVQNNKQSILILQTIMPYNIDDFLITHSVRSTVFAIIIGMQMELSEQQLSDLAVSCILHEIGLTHIPEAIYGGAEKLTEEEKKYLHVHPILSCKILKKSKFSLPICLGVLDHHETENATGYPQRLPGEKISRYGKIIAVACSYEAAIAPRRYKEALEPAEGLINLFMHKHALYDDVVLRALLCSLSFFPLGSFVVLSNRAIAQVIDTNPEDPRSPLVRIISGGSGTALSEAVQTSMTGISITRAARKDEWEEALAAKK